MNVNGPRSVLSTAVVSGWISESSVAGNVSRQQVFTGIRWTAVDAVRGLRNERC